MKKTMYGEIPLILIIKICKIDITCAYTLYIFIYYRCMYFLYKSIFVYISNYAKPVWE